jgi:hypothetical protein
LPGPTPAATLKQHPLATEGARMLILSRRTGEALIIDGDIEIVVLSV